MKSLLATILASCVALSGALAADANPAILSVTIDGKKYELKEGEALTLPTNAVPGKSQLTVALSPLQRYQMGAWRFVHPHGLSMDDDPAVFTSEEEAYEEARNRLLVARIARQIRLDRRVAEDEVVRVTLQDRDGTVLFEGDVR